MIFGPQFAFAHIPKTGGDALLEYLKTIPDVMEHFDDVDSRRKHEPFILRPESLEKPRLVLCLRNMVGWAMSMLHELQRQPKMREAYDLDGDHIFETDYVLSTIMPRIGPDAHLTPFLEGVEYDKLYWLRCERLKSDFIHFANTHLRTLTEVEHDIIIDHLGSQKGRQTYHKKACEVFPKEVIPQFVADNPLWSDIQGWVYSESYGPAWKIPYRSDT